jgi:hypothetical protein
MGTTLPSSIFHIWGIARYCVEQVIEFLHGTFIRQLIEYVSGRSGRQPQEVVME